MLNVSVMDTNSTSGFLSFRICLNGIYAGMIASYVVNSFCFIVGTPAQCWLLWLFLRDGWKIKPTRVFPLGLNVLELIYSIQSAALILNVLIWNSEVLWDVIFTFVCLSWGSRPLIQVCVSVEQYLAVLHPIIFLRYKDLQYRIVCIAVVWVVSAAFGLNEIFVHTFGEHINNFVFFISLIIILFCCVSVLRALKHPGPGDTQIPVERGRDVGNQQKRNAFNTIFTGLLIILITYLPQVLLSLIQVFQTDNKFIYCNISSFVNIFNILSVIITPGLKMYKSVLKPLKGN